MGIVRGTGGTEETGVQDRGSEGTMHRVPLCLFQGGLVGPEWFLCAKKVLREVFLGWWGGCLHQQRGDKGLVIPLLSAEVH